MAYKVLNNVSVKDAGSNSLASLKTDMLVIVINKNTKSDSSFKELNKISNINDHYHIQGLPNRFAGQGSEKYEQPVKGNKKFDTFKNWEKGSLKNSEYIALFPNVMIGLHLDHFYVFWLEPIATDKTKEHMHIYYVGEESANGDGLKELRKENARFWKDVMLEDISAIEGMQAGRGSPVYNGGNFSLAMDQPTHQFHKWVANNLI